tara:strand:- start:160 stop:399 length:240 start_codon:yes stop_codon:yes gene_type:complete
VRFLRLRGGVFLNKFFEKWIIEALEEMPDEFTVSHVLDNIVEKRGTSMYIGNTQGIGFVLCKREDLVTRIGDGVYRRND